VAASFPIPVVCALIERDGCVLVAQRPAHKSLPLKWEFPGGKVEPGERPATALIRELHEELGCKIAIIRALPGSTHRYDRMTIAMIPFVCRLTADSPEPQLHEHVAIRWMKAAEIASLDLAAADVPIAASYCAGE